MSIEKVRILIADPKLHDHREYLGDGITTRFDLRNIPIVEGSLSVTVNGIAQILGTDYMHADAYAPIIFVVAPASGDLVAADFQHSLLSDNDIAELLEIENNDLLLTAAQALDIIASNQSLVLKKIRTMDLQTDGPAVAESLRKHAAELRRQAEIGSGVDFAEMDVNQFAKRNLFYNKFQRGEL